MCFLATRYSNFQRDRVFLLNGVTSIIKRMHWKTTKCFLRVFFLFGLLHATAEINALFVRVHHVNKKMILGTLTSGANVANAVYFYKTSFNCKMHFYVSVRVYYYFHVHIGR